MIRRRNPARMSAGLMPFLSLVFMLLLLSFSLSGCQRKGHTSNPQLKKIDQLLASQLPKGTERGRVEFFLNSRGYRIEDSPDKTAVVAIVRHIDTETLRPASARVTFHFDSNNKLLSYELQPAPDAPLLP